MKIRRKMPAAFTLTAGSIEGRGKKKSDTVIFRISPSPLNNNNKKKYFAEKAL